MFPWLWMFAPQLHDPLSGSVAQPIEPDWFFGAFTPQAGRRIEQKAFGVASCGRQPGLIAEVLAEQQAPRSAKGRAARARLKDIEARIEGLKDTEYEEELGLLEARVKAIRRRGGAEREQLEKRLLPLLTGG